MVKPDKTEAAHRTPEEFKQKKKALVAKRGSFPTLWQEVAEHILPDRAEFLTRSVAGERRGGSIFDTTAIDANLALAGYLQSNLTSQSSDWFTIGPKRQELKDMWDVKRWFEMADSIMTASFSNSEYYNAMSVFYTDLPSLGTAPMFIDRTLGPFNMLFRPFSCRDALLAEDQYGEIDTLYRPFEWTLRQCAMAWGKENLSPDYQKLLDSGKEEEKVPILHAVEPRPDRKTNLELSQQMPVASVYMEEKTGHFLEVGGYMSFPFVVGRFYKWGDDPYGRCPGMLALPDICTADDQDKTNLGAGHLAVRPPLNIPVDMDGKIRMTPDALNYMGKSNERVTPIHTGINGLPYSIEMQKERQERIKSKFFMNVIMMMDQSGNVYKNIPEIAAREQEKMNFLGPMVGRFMHQVLGKTIERSFMLHMVNGMFPPPPRVLEGEEIEIEYISPLARTMKQLEGSSVNQAMALSMPIFESKPESLDLINGDEWVRWAFGLYQTPSAILNSPDAVQENRMQRAEQAQQQQQNQDMMMATQGVKNLAEADRATGNKLSENLEGSNNGRRA